MDKRIVIAFALIATVGLSLLAFLIGNTLNQPNNNQAPEDTSAAEAYCLKAGENFAMVNATFNISAGNQKAANLGMGHSLFISLDNNSETSYIAARDAIKEAINNGITPIMRLCVGQSCGFSDVNTLISMLQRLSGDAQITGDFYVIAGPNEPISETWLGGTPGNPDASAVANYANAVLNQAGSLPKVKVLSPAFNSTHPNFDTFAGNLKSAGLNWNSFDAIALNAYNVKGYSVNGTPLETISQQLQRVKNQFPGQRYMITETGMYESERNTDPIKSTVDVPHSEALVNFRNQVVQLQSDTSVLGYLIFNSFGYNTDSNFQYNVMQDSEFSQVLGAECIGSNGGGGTCPADINPQLWYGCPGEPSVGCNGLSGWIEGSSIPSDLEVGTLIDVNCFADGGAFQNSGVSITKDGVEVAGGNNFFFRDFSLSGPGEYSVSCTSLDDSTCTASDSFTITSNGGGTQCPAYVGPVFIVDGNILGQKEDTIVDPPINSIRVAATTDGGTNFNNFNGNLIVSGSETHTFLGTETSDLTGPFEPGDQFVLEAYVGDEFCDAKSTLTISGSITNTPTQTPSITPTSIQPTNTIRPSSTPTVGTLPDTAIENFNLPIGIGITMFLVGTWLYFISDIKDSKL